MKDEGRGTGGFGIVIDRGVILPLLAFAPIRAMFRPVKAKTVSFEQLQRDKRRERLRDDRRLARGELTPEQIEEENSLFPMDAPVEIPKLWTTLRKYYAK